MRKIVFVFILNLICLSSFGQLNPIKNLQFTHSYQTPNNCYWLSWDMPDVSATDSLIGYNIYRDDSLYRFTTDLSQNCQPCIGDTSTTHCSFMVYNMGMFYIHVTAIYNAASMLESGYNDSADFGGLATGIKEQKENYTFSINPNPFNSFTILRTEKLLKNATISIYNSIQQVRQLKNISGNEVSLLRDNLTAGLYFIRITEGDKLVAADKLLISE